MRRRLLIATASLVMSLSLVPCAASAAPTKLPAPTNVSVSARVGEVIVSWKQLASSFVTYTVTSLPPGEGCQVVDAPTCAIPIDSLADARFIVTASTASSVSAASTATPPITTKLLLVVAGQSNATGTHSYAVDPLTGIRYLSSPFTNGADTYAKLAWSEPGVKAPPRAGWVPLDTPQLVGTKQVFGPEIGLARQLYADTGRSVRIVKVAAGGTSLAFGWNPQRPGGLFDMLRRLVWSQMSLDAASGTVDVLDGVYWYQGESDATRPAWAAAYREHLQNFIAAVRSGLPLVPGAPFVVAKESSAAYIAYLQARRSDSRSALEQYAADDALVRAADDWAGANLQHVIVVDTVGLPRVAPGIHLRNTAELRLGKDLAKASEPDLVTSPGTT
jgi:carbohydrate esterase-like sialic acid-specific acetylesterase